MAETFAIRTLIDNIRRNSVANNIQMQNNQNANFRNPMRNLSMPNIY